MHDIIIYNFREQDKYFSKRGHSKQIIYYLYFHKSSKTSSVHCLGNKISVSAKNYFSFSVKMY